MECSDRAAQSSDVRLVVYLHTRSYFIAQLLLCMIALSSDVGRNSLAKRDSKLAALMVLVIPLFFQDHAVRGVRW